MKKHIANIITGSRIVLSLPLLFIPLTSAWFYAFYLLCGLSDIIDGTVARRTKSASEFGARLDTVSDFVFMTRGFDQIPAASSYPRMAVDMDRYYRHDQAWKRCLEIYSHEKTHIPSYRSE